MLVDSTIQTPESLLGDFSVRGDQLEGEGRGFGLKTNRDVNGLGGRGFAGPQPGTGRPGDLYAQEGCRPLYSKGKGTILEARHPRS